MNFQVHMLPMKEVYSDDEFNCRGKIAPIDVIPLAQSIEEKGLQTPITVQPYTKVPGYKYRIVMGHRRYVAFKINKQEVIPCFIATDLDEFAARTQNLIENLNREDLNIMQEAHAIRHFRMAGWTVASIAKQINKSTGWVNIRLTALDMDPLIQKEIANDMLTQDQILQLSRIKKPEKRLEAVRLIKERKEKGEATSFDIVKPKVKGSTRRERKRHEIFEFMSLVQKTIGNSFATRCLAWTAGEISEYEIHKDLKREAEEKGKTYDIPKELYA